MKYTLLFVLLVLATVAHSQYVIMSLISSDKCTYGFKNGNTANFTLPPAQNGGQPDHQLNVNNPITYNNGKTLTSGMYCNGDVTQYQLDNGTWTSTYVDSNNNTQNTINLFYATPKDAVNIRTIQEFQADIITILNGRNARLNVTCLCGSGNLLKMSSIGLLLSLILALAL